MSAFFYLTILMQKRYDITWLIDKFESGDTLKYIYFWGNTEKDAITVSKTCLSQWYEAPFTVNNIRYNTSEHWMMANKALLFNDRITFDRIIKSTKPGEAKELGRQVSGFNDELWREKRFDIVKLGNIHKFNQNSLLGVFLLNTGNRVLVEASPVDKIWGIGMAEDNPDIDNIYAWQGENLLGFVLMEVRDDLRTNGFFEPVANSLIAPWNKYPDIEYQDMFWRMGEGEEYIMQFSNFFNALSERDKMIYQLYNPEPISWTEFY